MSQTSSRIKTVAVSLGSTAALASATQAHAAIIANEIATGGSQQVTDTTAPPDEFFALDLYNDTNPDVNVSSKYNKSKPGAPEDTTKHYSYSGDKIAATPGNAIVLTPLNAGDEIGPSLAFVDGGNVTATYNSGAPSAYYALRFGATAPYNYGWIQLREGASPNAWDVVAYGVETTPDTPIAAGAVPEPASLGALAIGAAAVALRRRGKKA